LDFEDISSYSMVVLPLKIVFSVDSFITGF
jgi:hypothetical protein